MQARAGGHLVLFGGIPTTCLSWLDFVEFIWVFVVSVALKHGIEDADGESFEAAYVSLKGNELDFTPLSNPVLKAFFVGSEACLESHFFDTPIFRQPRSKLSIVGSYEVLAEPFLQIRRFPYVQRSCKTPFPNHIAPLCSRRPFDNLPRRDSGGVQQQTEFSLAG